MSSKTHAIGSRTKEGVTITVCGKVGLRRFDERRNLHTIGGDQIDLHRIRLAPTCKLCLKHSKFQDWSL
jgi:hypothetical protein